MRAGAFGIILIMAAALAPAGARAQNLAFPPITNRNFNIDLFEQPAIGSPRLISMAGAINAVSEGAAGLYTNPASAAIRPETHIDKFAWNVYLNSYIPVDGQDLNNNGQVVTTVRRSLLGAAGLLFQYGVWGASLDAGYTAHEIAPEAGGGLGVRSIIAHLTVARTFLDQALSVGVGVRAGGLNVYTLMGSQQLFTRAGASGEAGAVWMPKDKSYRFGASGAAPIYTGAIQYNCDPNDCYGYILPSDAIVPWDATFSAAYRFGETPWNHRVEGDYRDERSLTVALDLTLVGAVENGYGMEAFAAKQLQISGRDVSPTPRLGLESEVIRGWLRLRAGTYLEASRFMETSARWHATGGFEVRVFAFRLGGHERRVAVSGAADVASEYKNLGFSIGFWN
ncbi:MAG TPA: hypothetical protein VHO67_05680 [Polyangia bacterium]|nr:hypothetical protein [Polyangia bacterium]